MAPALTRLDEPGLGTRWHVRAGSIGATVGALSRIWGEVVREARASDLDERTRAEVRGDPRLAPALDGEREVRLRTRPSVLTLVVVAPRPETRERAVAAVDALAARHPSRAVILAPGDPDGPSSFRADIHAACLLPRRGSTEVCTETITVRVGGELSAHLASTLAPLVIHDLPVLVWWPDDVPFGRPVFRELVDQADRLLVDSGLFRADGRAGLAELAGSARDGLVLCDMSWMRLMLWREQLASAFDHPLLRRELRSVARVRVDLARPGATDHLARACLFVGWLMSRLGWSVTGGLSRAEDGIWRATLKTGRREVALELHPVSVDAGGPVRAAGSLVRVELSSGRTAAQTRVRVTRQSDHLLATADWNGAQILHHATRLEPFEEMPFLAEAIERTSPDRIFDMALAAAVRLAT